MNPVRTAATAAAILTALLLQAAVVGPATALVAVSLPAVLVALIALADGPGAGLTLGFVCGLLADLGSTHPAGVLALVWMGMGMACGLARDPRRAPRWQVVLAASAATAAAVAATAVLLAVGAAHGSAAAALRDALLSWPGDLVLALLLRRAVVAVLRSPAIRARAAVPHA